MGGMFGPANLPKEIITRLLEIMRETEVIETLGKPGFVLPLHLKRWDNFSQTKSTLGRSLHEQPGSRRSHHTNSFT